MRNIFIILFSLLVGIATAQTTPPPTGTPNTLNRFAGGASIDSFSKVAPVRDTTSWFGRKSDFVRMPGSNRLFFFDGLWYREIVGAFDSTGLYNSILQRVKYSDTAGMLAPYGVAINQRVKYGDTAAMLLPYQVEISQRVRYSDTAAMLAAYQSAINDRVKYSDTAGMLFPLWTSVGLKANDDAVVHLSGAETISGIKTFSASPLVPGPTTSGQAANKSYVDALGSSVASTYIPLTFMGAANGVATLGPGGKIPNNQIPAIAITETFVVNSQAAMLALSAAEQGDVAVRTDLSKSFILTNNSPGALSNWQELLSPTVTNSDQVPEGSTNLYFTVARARLAISGGTGIGYNSSTGVITNTSPNLQSNLSLGSATSTTQPINNSDGTGVTLPVATGSAAGLMSGSDKTKLDGFGSASAYELLANKATNFNTINNTLYPTLSAIANKFANGSNVAGQLKFLNNPDQYDLSPANMDWMWHDQFAFGRNISTWETTTDFGANWTTGTANLGIFNQKQSDASNTVLLTNTSGSVNGLRIKWTGFNFGQLNWIITQLNFTGTTCFFNMLVEESSDNVNFTSLATYTGLQQAGATTAAWRTPQATATYTRVTFMINGGLSPAGATATLKNLRGMALRAGDQGGGKEFEFPYTWTNEKFMRFIFPNYTPASGSAVLPSNYRIALLNTTNNGELTGSTLANLLQGQTLAPSGTAGGDLSGTYPNPTVARLNGQLPAYYLSRANHTGTQPQNTVSSMQDSLDSRVKVSNGVNNMTTGGSTWSIYGLNGIGAGITTTGSGMSVYLKTNSIGFAKVKTDLLAGPDRIFQFPNADGTFALTSDLPSSGTMLNWTAAYNDKINSAAFSGTGAKTLTLTQQDGGTVTASFNDADTPYIAGDNISIAGHVITGTGAPASGSANYLQNQYTGAQTAEAWISGRVKASSYVGPNNNFLWPQPDHWRVAANDGSPGKLKVGSLVIGSDFSIEPPTDFGLFCEEQAVFPSGIKVGASSLPAQALDVTGTIRQSAVTSSMLKANASGDVVAAVSNTDYLAPSAVAITGVALGDGFTLSGLASSTAKQILRRNPFNTGYEWWSPDFMSLNNSGQTMTGNGEILRFNDLDEFIIDEANKINISTDEDPIILNGNGGTILQPTTGNVGIGTSTPSGRLETVSTGTSAATVIDSYTDYTDAVYISSSSSALKNAIVMRGKDDGIGSAIESGRENPGGNWNTYLSFYTNNVTGGATTAMQEKVRITGDGNVGIGTSAPGAKLDVNGGINSGAGNITLSRNLTDQSGRRNWGFGTENNTVGDFMLSVSSTNTGSPSTPVMTGLSDGKIGIGTTSPTERLHIVGNAKIDGNITANNLSSGSYTPTVTFASGSFTPEGFRYIRVGNIVNVTGRIVATPGVDITGTISLPVASNIIDSYDVTGVVSGSGINSAPNHIRGDGTGDNALLTFNPSTPGSLTLYVSFSYVVQ